MPECRTCGVALAPDELRLCRACWEAEDAMNDDYDDDPGCSWCGGDGWEECTDTLAGCGAGCTGRICPCGACNGSGLAKDQVVW